MEATSNLPENPNLSPSPSRPLASSLVRPGKVALSDLISHAPSAGEAKRVTSRIVVSPATTAGKSTLISPGIVGIGTLARKFSTAAMRLESVAPPSIPAPFPFSSSKLTCAPLANRSNRGSLPHSALPEPSAKYGSTLGPVSNRYDGRFNPSVFASNLPFTLNTGSSPAAPVMAPEPSLSATAPGSIKVAGRKVKLPVYTGDPSVRLTKPSDSATMERRAGLIDRRIESEPSSPASPVVPLTERGSSLKAIVPSKRQGPESDFADTFALIPSSILNRPTDWSSISIAPSIIVTFSSVMFSTPTGAFGRNAQSTTPSLPICTKARGFSTRMSKIRTSPLRNGASSASIENFSMVMAGDSESSPTFTFSKVTDGNGNSRADTSPSAFT